MRNVSVSLMCGFSALICTNDVLYFFPSPFGKYEKVWNRMLKMSIYRIRINCFHMEMSFVLVRYLWSYNNNVAAQASYPTLSYLKCLHLCVYVLHLNISMLQIFAYINNACYLRIWQNAKHFSDEMNEHTFSIDECLCAHRPQSLSQNFTRAQTIETPHHFIDAYIANAPPPRMIAN